MRVTIRHSLIALGLAALIGTASQVASAQSGEGTIRLGGEATVFDLIIFPDVVGSVDFGVFGGFGANGAYQITENILVGGRISFGGFFVDPVGPGDSGTSGFLNVLPYFEFDIPGDVIQPFFGAEIGPFFSFPAGGDTDVDLVGGGFGGIHIFATNDFSISPTGHAGFRHDFDSERAAFEFAISVSFLGWIGSGGEVAVQYN